MTMPAPERRLASERAGLDDGGQDRHGGRRAQSEARADDADGTAAQSCSGNHFSALLQCKYSEMVWLLMSRAAPTSANANRLTGLPNTYSYSVTVLQWRRAELSCQFPSVSRVF